MIPIQPKQFATISATADDYRLGKARLETGINDGDQSAPNVQRVGLITLGSCTLNADGTITIPSGATLVSEQYGQYHDPSGTNPAQNWYGKVVAVDAPAAAGELQIQSDWDSGVIVFSAYAATTEPLPGVYENTWINAISVGGVPTAQPYFQWYVKNNAASDRRIYPPRLYMADQSLLPGIDTYLENVMVPSLPVQDLDWRHLIPRGDRSGRHRDEKTVTKAVDSVAGSSGNAGTLYAPKLTLSDIATPLVQGDVIGLYRGGVWRESLPTGAGITTKGIEVQDIALGGIGPLPKVSAFDPVVDNTWTANGDGTYSKSWTVGTSVANNGYDEVFVNEINTATLALYPITSENRLTSVASSAACIAAAGTAYLTLSGTTATAQIHPTDGAAPGTLYTYEVIARYCPSEWTQYARDGKVAGLMLHGASFGYGPLAGTTKFVGDRLIIMHPTTHGFVAGGGGVERFLIWGKGNLNTIGATFYQDNATGLRFFLRDGYILGSPSAVYAHNSGGGSQSFERGDVERVVAVSARKANGALYSSGMGCGSVKKLRVHQCYVDSFMIGFFAGATDATSEVTESLFRNCGRISSVTLFKDNIVATQNIADPDNVDNRNQRCAEVTTGQTVTNNLYYASYITTAGGTQSNDNSLGVVFGTSGAAAAAGTFTKNIVLMDKTITGNLTVSNLATDHSALTIDYNVYIQCGGADMAGYPGTNGWAAWLTNGTDAHSLYIDLRDDPRGAKAVFMDPTNGDFRFAQTDVARKVRAYCLANGVGPAKVISRWPVIPTADEIAKMIEQAG